MKRRYVLTGAPGSGKTALLRALELRGYAVVEEAATDVNALAHAQGVDEPWRQASFIDDILALQRLREERAEAGSANTVVFDRSPVCTWALSEFLGRPPSELLKRETERIERDAVFRRRVLFAENLGFCEPTAVRRISFEDTLRFEQVHAQVYRRFGYELVPLPRGPLDARLAMATGELGPP
jgi:predicted ATPase